MTREKWLKILKGAALAAGGALVAYGLSELVPAIEQSGALGAAVASIVAVVLNAARQWLTSQSQS